MPDARLRLLEPAPRSPTARLSASITEHHRDRPAAGPACPARSRQVLADLETTPPSPRRLVPHQRTGSPQLTEFNLVRYQMAAVLLRRISIYCTNPRKARITTIHA
jgi:hypothetical protein